MGIDIVAAGSGRLVRVGQDGATRGLASTTGTVFRLVHDSAGGLVFIDRMGDRARVYRTAMSGTVTELASGPLTGIGLARGAEVRRRIRSSPPVVGRRA